MYTCNQPYGARTWMPCVDSSADRCAWEIVLVVPKQCTAVAPGQLQDQLGVSDESTRSFVYKTAKHEKYSAGSIVLSVGVYETVNDAQWPYITHYCLPNRQRALTHVTSYLPQIIAFYENYLGNKYPYSSYKQVFVEDAYSSVLSGASLSVLSTHLLHDDKVIDQTFETRRLLALTLAQQWFGHFIAVKSWSDQWLVFGLAGYMSYLFVLKVFGYNEFRYRLVRDVEYISQHAHINQPLYNTNYTSAADLYSKLVFVKSTVTMYLLEKRLGTEGFQKLLSGLVVKNAEGDPPDTNVSTSKFLKLAKKLTGLEMKMFADKWM
jgi:transcription initiation factor TFIID subunit 2